MTDSRQVTADERQLIERVLEHGTLVARFHLKAPQDVEDVVHAFCLKLLEKPRPRPTLQEGEIPWIKRCVRNACFDHLRQQRVRNGNGIVDPAELVTGSAGLTGGAIDDDEFLAWFRPRLARYVANIESLPNEYSKNHHQRTGAELAPLAGELRDAMEYALENGEMPPHGRFSPGTRRRLRERLQQLAQASGIAAILLSITTWCRKAFASGATWKVTALGTLAVGGLVGAAALLRPIHNAPGRVASDAPPAVQLGLGRTAAAGVVPAFGGAMPSNDAGSPRIPGDDTKRVRDLLEKRSSGQRLGLHLLFNQRPLRGGSWSLKLYASKGHIGINNSSMTAMTCSGLGAPCELQAIGDEFALACECERGPELLFIGWVEDEPCGVMSGNAWMRGPGSETSTGLGAWALESNDANCNATYNLDAPNSFLSTDTHWFDVNSERIRQQACRSSTGSWLICDPTWSVTVPGDIASERLLRKGTVWWKYDAATQKKLTVARAGVPGTAR